MDRIVLGYDGSAGSRAALEWVAQRSERRLAAMEIVTVPPEMLLAEEDTAQDRTEEAQRRLQDLAPRVQVIRVTGSPESLSDARTLSGLTVIGVELGAASRFRRRPLRLATRSDQPVCLVPSSWVPSDKPVTLGLDDDDSSDDALVFACSEANAATVPLRIVHAWPTDRSLRGDGAGSVSPPHAPRGVYQHTLDTAAERVHAQFPGLRVQLHLVHDNAAAALALRAQSSSLIVIGRHERAPVSSWVLGSVGRDLIGRLPTPLCVVPRT